MNENYYSVTVKLRDNGRSTAFVSHDEYEPLEPPKVPEPEPAADELMNILLGVTTDE